MDNPRDKIIAMNSENECGVNELFEMLIFSFYKNNENMWECRLRLPFDEDSLRRLLKKAYASSLLAEEGRYPRFRIILGSNRDELFPFTSVVRFQSPIVINEANDLRKLAPSVPEPSFALWVAEGGDESNRRLECISIIDADRSFKTTFIGMPDSRVDSNGVGGDELPLPVEAAEAIADSRVGGNGVGGDTEFAIIKIEGAGSLRARFALQREEYVLRGGRIRPKMSFAYLEVMIPLVKTVLAALESTSSAMDFLRSWARVLEVANSKRHGAAFLLLPEQEISPKEIREKYRFSGGFEVSLNLGKAFTEFAVACECYRYHAEFEAVSHRQQMELLSNQWLARRQYLYRMQEALAALSGVDGCVVLDQSLKAHLFGAKIQTIRDREKLPLVDYYRPDTNIEEKMKSLGTRNNSACLFCQEHPGAFAFVLSQDSDLRLYFSNEKVAYAFLDLDTYM